MIKTHIKSSWRFRSSQIKLSSAHQIDFLLCSLREEGGLREVDPRKRSLDVQVEPSYKVEFSSSVRKRNRCRSQHQFQKCRL